LNTPPSVRQVRAAEVVVEYPTSGGYRCCQFHCAAEQIRMRLEFTGWAQGFNVDGLLPGGRRVKAATLHGRTAKAAAKDVEEYNHAIFRIPRPGVHVLELSLM
jgi:hypothetical protein